MTADIDSERIIPQSTLRELRGILISSLSRENLGILDHPVPAPRRRKVHFQEAGAAAPVDVNHRNNSRPSSANRGLDREERVRIVRERQQSERQRKLEELRAHALAAQRFREQKEEERRKRIEDMRNRDNDRRHQVEERKKAIYEAERERREAILKRNEERDARLEHRRRTGCASAGVFAFGSSTPRMLEPADTGGTFWGTRRATSTSNVMFTALPLSRRSSERELDPREKRATSASGLDRQQGNDFRVSSSMYEIFHWNEYGGTGAVGSRPLSVFQPSNQGDDGNADPIPWSRVARRRTDLVPTIPMPRSETAPPSRPTSAARSPGRAYSMTRLDQLAQPRKPLRVVLTTTTVQTAAPAPSRPPRHRSMGNLAAASGGPSPPPRTKHAKQNTQQQSASGLRSGEITPGSPSRPDSSLSSTSTTGAMTASVTGGLVTRRPRTAPRRPRPISIAGTGVSTPPHAKTTTVGADGKPIGVRAEKPPLPRVHSAGITAKKPTATEKPQVTEKPEVPKRTNKTGPVKPSPKVTPRATPLQSPATEVAPIAIQAKEPVKLEQQDETVTSTQSEMVEITNDDNKETIVTETVKQVTKESNGDEVQETITTVTTTTEVVSNGKVDQEDDKSAMPDLLSEGMENLKISAEKAQKNVQPTDPLENADMTGSMMAKKLLTTEEEAKAALAERRRLAREEAERQAEKERLRLQKEAEEEAERQRQEEERQRQLEEETIRLQELQRKAEEERLQQAILEAQRQAEEEKARKESEARAKAEKEAAEAKAREEAEKQRKETAERLQREEQEREARKKRVEAIMQRTRQAKQKKDGDKSPSEENKSMENSEQSNDNKAASDGDSSQMGSQQDIQSITNDSSYEQSVREREQHLLNHMAPHNQTAFVKQVEVHQNGTSNGDSIIQSNNYATQNGHSKNQELNSFMNNSNDNQFGNLVALDNTVKQNISTNNLVSISEFDLLNNTANSNNPFLVDTNGTTMQNNANSNVNQIIDLNLDPFGKVAVNEDSVNSNPSVNSPFITSFQDNQENRDVSLL